MLTISNSTAGHDARGVAPIDRIQAHVEVSYCDAAKVGCFAISDAALPGLAAGDRIYVSSGGTGAYRTVLRVEPIAGGAMMILLDPGHVTSAPPTSIK